ncbi:MAG TPA: thioesterase family protein, partial [Anaerolineales bacterium]|nr:thioesterase family protein [Anaerolineales bacterium]
KVVELAHQGINLVVIRLEIDYLWPLRSGDEFYVGLNVERVSRLRFAILEDIYRTADEKPILKAKVVATAIDKDGRPMRPPKELEPLFA